MLQRSALTTTLSLFFGMLLSGCQPEAADQPAPDAAATGPLISADDGGTRLELRVSAFSDFYFLVRAQAGGVVPAESELQPIIDAWMPVQDEIGTFGGFWRFDLPGLQASSPEEYGEWFSDAPESLPSRAGGTIPIRGPGQSMAEAMEDVWPAFRDRRWPARELELDEVLSRLEREFLPEHRQALQHMLSSLGIPDPEIEVPTYLVLEAHAPGASTYRTRSGPVAVLSTRDLLDEGRFSDLEETLLHETCHALDLASEGEEDAFSVLRALLREQGVEDGDRRLHDIPHLVMFAQAENTMRRIYDANHVAYGDTRRGDIAPLYERSGRAAVVVRAVWGDFLDGDLTRDQALRRIVDVLLAE